MKRYLIFGCFLLFIHQIVGQYTQVPDPNFEQALIDLGYDDVLDGQFLTANAIGVLDLNVDEKGINDLTGIEAFVDLEQLFAYGNYIQFIDLSNLPETLWTLDLGNNNLNDIDLSPVSQVVNLYLGSNNLNTIDASNLTNLFILHVSNQYLQNLILTNCTNLFSLGCVNTSLQSIDLSTCVNLTYLNAYDSQISTLDFSGNQEIEEIDVRNTSLSSINLPNNPILSYLSVSNTQLSELDITDCSGLETLYFNDTNISQIDFSNNPVIEIIYGNNSSMTTIDVTNNPNLLWLVLRNNNLTGTINLSNNPLLDQVSLRSNLLEEMDFSQNPLVTIITINENPNLQFINMNNSANEDLILLLATDCPNLSCVVVDDPSAPNDNIAVDPHTILVGSVEDCELSYIENIQNSISVYPNPVRNDLRIDVNDIAQITSIQIYDVLGRLVMTVDDGFDQIDVSHLNSGVLFVEIETEQGVITKKIIKE